jgi:hypothetical protein
MRYNIRSRVASNHHTAVARGLVEKLAEAGWGKNALAFFFPIFYIGPTQDLSPRFCKRT